MNYKILELLKRARCPDIDCDNKGTVACRISDDEWEAQPCQWCAEKNAILDEYDHHLIADENGDLIAN